MSNDSTLVLYKSKYGSTKQYAEWIAAALSAPVKSIDEASEGDLLSAETVVVGGAVRVGKITCAKFILRHWDVLKSRQVILFSVSGKPPSAPEVLRYFEGSLPEHIRSSIHFFALPGRHGMLDAGDRIAMWFPLTFLKMQMRFAKSPEARSVAAEEYRQMSEPYDHVDRQHIEPILTSLKNSSQKTRHQ